MANINIANIARCAPHHGAPDASVDSDEALEQENEIHDDIIESKHRQNHFMIESFLQFSQVELQFIVKQSKSSKSRLLR